MNRTASLLCLPLLWILGSPSISAEERSAPAMAIEIVETGGAQSAIVTYGTFEHRIELEDGESLEATIVPAALGELPMAFTVEWADQHTVSLPALWLGLPSGEKLRIRLYRNNFEPADQRAAENLCHHTEINNPIVAYRALFGCQEWTILMEREDPRWTASHLKGLNGWLKGAYYLFATQKASGGIGVGYWGMQPELIERLEDVMLAIREGRKTAASFKPLRVADVEKALVEAQQWELKLNRRIPGLLLEGNLAEARQVAGRVLYAYDRAVPSIAHAERSDDLAIDGLRRSDITRQIEDIDAKLAAAGLPRWP